MQEQKGEGGSEGHFEVTKEAKPEKNEELYKNEELLENYGGAISAGRNYTIKNSLENFKGVSFRLEEKGQKIEQNELHMLEPYQTGKVNKS